MSLCVEETLVIYYEYYFKKTWNKEIIEPLDPRDALYGGRTEPTKLLYICPKNYKLRYIDVFSLYLTVMF